MAPKFKLNGHKVKIGSLISSLLSAIGAGGGTVSTVCQTACSATLPIIPFLGIALSSTPLAFIGKYQVFIWLIAFSFFLILLWNHLVNHKSLKLDKALLFINGGLLVIGFPFFKHSAISSTFPWIGLSSVIIGLFFLTMVLLK